MIRWEDYFDGAVLRQGKDAEARGLVRNLQRLSDGSYTCTSVLPGGMRTPRVRVGDDENLKMSCSCPDFTGKGKCVHTASLCAAIEKKYPEAFGNVLFWSRDTLNDSRTDPFCEDHDTFFSVKDIFSGRYIITKSMVRIAEHMMAKGTAVHSSFNVGTGADGSPLLIGICTVSDGVRQVSVRLEAAPHALIHIACSDGTCSEFSTEGNGIICIHKLVMFLLASRYIRENNPAPRTNAAAEGMMKLLKKSRQLVIPDRIVRGRGTGNPIDIIPVLNYGMNELSFLVGKEKTYAVRSIAELMHCIKERLTLFYGKYLSMDFASDKLTERAGAVLSFIRTSGNAHGDRTLPITSENIGKFYELCRNVEVLDSEKRPLRAAEGECRLKYDFIAEKYHGKEGVITACISFPVRDSSGEYAYSSGNGEIRRMNVSSLGLLASIYPEKEPFTEKYVFGADSVGEFYMTVLPELEKHGDVDESAFSETGFWKEKRPVFSFFLDYAKAVVTAAVHVTYQTDDYILSPFEREPDDDRLPGEEEWVCRQVEVFLPVRRKGYWESVPRSDDQIYDFINQGIEAFRALGEVSVSDSLKRIIKKRPVKMKFGISLSDGLLDLKAVGDGLSPEEIVDILTSYRLKKRYHRLKDGEFVDLNSKDVESLSEMTSSLGLSDDDIENGGKHYSPFMSPYIDEVFTSNDDFQCEKDSAFRTMMKDFTCFRESEDEVPSELNAELRPYQKDGFRWLKTLHDCGFGGILADEMGLGKTVQVIAFIACLKEKGKGGPSLVVCPSSLVYNWEAEVRKFAPSLNVMVVSGIPSVRRMLLFGYREADVIITSYDSLKRDTGLYEGRRFHLCFLDEAQYIKNHDTEAAKSVKKIESDVRFALTGTPIENRLSELWSIFDFLMSGYLRTYDAFRTEFEIPVMKEKNREASVRLQKLVSPFILRRLKSDVLKDLPEKLEEVSLCELTGEQRKLYDARVHLIRKDIENSSDEEFSKNRLMILSELTRLRQLCCDPSLCYENFMEPSAKLEATMELIERAIDEGHRMLLFSQFTSMLSRIAAELDRRHIMYFTITGATAKEERVRLVDAFNRGNTPVFLISLKAGGTGLNLTGADVVIHYDPWWNGAVQDQATDRAHRIGQTKVVTVYSMIAKDTIEEKIKELQESKKDLADEILSGEHVSLSSLSRAELLDLLS